jgi:serine/threonine-protein kinase
MPLAKPNKPELLRSDVVRKRVWSAGRILVLVGALGLTYGVFFLGAMRMANRAREVAVPDLRGKSVAEATALVAGAGLALKVEPLRRPDPKVAADHVLTQEPDPGFMLRRQRTVRIRVSDGVKDPEVPLVVGQTERTAEITLAHSHIGISGRAEIQTADYPADTIVAQDPPAKGRASSVSVLVNHGAAGLTFVMPDLIATFGGQVQQIMRQRGFRVAIVGEESYPGLPPGVVVRQVPTAGFQIGPGEAISLTVSR